MDFEDIGEKERASMQLYSKRKAAEYRRRANKNKNEVESNLEDRIKVFQKNPTEQNPKEPTQQVTNAYKHLFQGEATPKEQIYVGNVIKRKMAKDPKKQSFDEKYLKNRIKATGINNDERKKYKENEDGITFKEKKYLKKDGDLTSDKNDEERAQNIKSSDAIISAEGKTVFCTFKSTFSDGGGQDHQKNEAFEVVKKAKRKGVYTIAVLDGAYYFDVNGKPTKKLAEAIAKSGNKKFYLYNIEFENVMHAGVFVERVRQLAEAIKQKNSVIKESVITEEEVIEAQKFLNSLNNVEAAMKQQNMNVSKLQRVKQGFLAFMGKLRALGSSIKKGINNIKNRIKGNV